MGVVSFKVARMGTRYRPKPVLVEEPEPDHDHDHDHANALFDEGSLGENSNSLTKLPQHSNGTELEVSFSLNLFPNGFSLGEVPEFLNRAPEHLLPYNRDSEPLLSAIENGRLPGDVLDDNAFKFVNGRVLCQIRDYRDRSIPNKSVNSIMKSPVVHKVTLQMCMENVVKDMKSITDESWSYEDMLRFESCVLEVLRPVLYLNPTPSRKKIDLEISWSWSNRENCSNALITSSTLNNSCHITSDPPGNLIAQKPDFETPTVNQDRRVSLAKENNPSPIPPEKEFSGPQFLHLDSAHNPNVTVLKRNPSPIPPEKEFSGPQLLLLDSANNPNVTVPKRNPRKRGSVQAKWQLPNLAANSNRGRKQANNNNNTDGPILKKPKVALMDLSFQGSAEIGTSSYPHCVEPEKAIRLGPRNRAKSNVKQEIAETRYLISDLTSARHQQTPLPKSNNPIAHPLLHTVQNPVVHSVSTYSETAPVIERFRKIEVATQKHSMTKKRKMDQYLLPDQQFNYHPSYAVASQLSNSEDVIKVEDSGSGLISSSKIADRNVPNIRSLKFVRKQSHGNDSENEVGLVLQQNLNNETVEAYIRYGREGYTNSTLVSLSPKFPTSLAADQFASQFAALIAREGYDLVTDQIDQISQSKPGYLSNQPSRMVELTSLTPIPMLSNSLINPVSPRMSHLNSPRQSLQPNSRNANLLPESLVNFGPQFPSLTQQTQESSQRQAQIRHQIQQRVIQQERLKNLTELLGGSGAPPGAVSRPYNDLRGFHPHDSSSMASGNVGYLGNNRTNRVRQVATSNVPQRRNDGLVPNVSEMPYSSSDQFLNGHMSVWTGNVPSQRMDNGLEAVMNMPYVSETPRSSSNNLPLDGLTRFSASNVPIQRSNNDLIAQVNMTDGLTMPCNSSNPSPIRFLSGLTIDDLIQSNNNDFIGLLNIPNASEMPCYSSNPSLEGFRSNGLTANNVTPSRRRNNGLTANNVTPRQRRNNGLTAMTNVPDLSEMPCYSSFQAPEWFMRAVTGNVSIQRSSGLGAMTGIPNVSGIRYNSSNQSLEGLTRASTSNVPMPIRNGGLNAPMNLSTVPEMPCYSSNQPVGEIVRVTSTTLPIQIINSGHLSPMNISEMPCCSSHHQKFPIHQREIQWSHQQPELRSSIQNVGPSISSVVTFQQFVHQPQTYHRQSPIPVPETVNMFEKGYGLN